MDYSREMDKPHMTKPKTRLKKSESAVLLSVYAARLCKEEPVKQERTNRGEFSSLAEYGLIEIVDRDWSYGAKITGLPAELA